MKKRVNAILAMVLAMAVLLAWNPLITLAASNNNEVERTQNAGGVTVTWGCSITASSAFASTVTNAGYVWTTTDAYYYSSNTDPNAGVDELYYDLHRNNSGYYASSVSFSTLAGYQSDNIDSYHTADVSAQPVSDSLSVTYTE